MAVPIEVLRKLLSEPLADDAARALKEWRRQENISQTEAAIRIGIPVRTLQGWELGRPMRHPSLLQRVANIRAPDRYSLVQSDFPREFAEFIDFVGANTLHRAVLKVDNKLSALSRSVRPLFGDRYFFHEQCIRFTESSAPFQLDVSDPVAVRAASLIAGINRVKRLLSSQGVSRLQAMVIDNLKPDMDVRQIEHEVRCSTHFGRKGFGVNFADLEGLGRFDLLVTTPSGSVQIECKTVTEDTGSQIKAELTVNLSDSFLKTVLQRSPVDESGLFILTLNKPGAECKNLAQQLRGALRSTALQSFAGSNFSLDFLPQPRWQELLDSEQLLGLKREISLDPHIKGYAHCITKAGNILLGLVIHPHKPSGLSRRVIAVIKEGADKCPHNKPSIVWLHFVGLAQAEFLNVAEFSMEGNGAGLNAIVAGAVHPAATRTDRSHVQAVRFSADNRDLNNHTTLASNLILARAVSADGACYDVPNSFCRFPEVGNL